MKSFMETVNDRKPLIIFAAYSILDIWQGSEYASGFDLRQTKLLQSWNVIDSIER